jgi:hypothetical protein
VNAIILHKEQNIVNKEPLPIQNEPEIEGSFQYK